METCQTGHKLNQTHSVRPRSKMTQAKQQNRAIAGCDNRWEV